MTRSTIGEAAPTSSPAPPSGRHQRAEDTLTSDSPMTHRQILEAMSGLMLALLVAILSSTIVSNALPRILADLGGSQSQYTWVVTAMLLTSTASTPIWGKLSDLFSKKLLYQIAITIFTLGSVLGGFAQSMPMLIGFRAVQGIGMGGLQALIQVVIAAMVSPRERGRYSGYIGATFAVATVSGPLAGGLIVDSPLGWRWCFWVTVPIAVIAFIVLGRTLKLPVIKRDVHIDWFGALFLVGGVSLLLIWVSLAGKQFPWASPETAGFVGGGVLALIIALIIESKVREPIVPLGMFRNRAITLATIGTVAVGTAMFGGSVFLGQYFQIARSYTPTYAGLMTLPMVLGLFVSSTVSGQIISRGSGKVKPFLVFGSLMLIAGTGLLSTMDHTTNLVLVGVYLAMMGIGVGSLMQNLVLTVQNVTASADMGSVTSVVTFFRTLGGSAGVSVLGAVLATRVSEYVNEGLAAMGVPVGAGGASAGGGSLDVGALPGPMQEIVRSAYGDAIGDIFFVSACISVVTLLAVLFIKEVPLRRTIGTQDDVRGEAVDSPLEVVDNSVGTETAPITRQSDSAQLAGVRAAVPRPADEPVDNSVGNYSHAWSTGPRSGGVEANGSYLSGDLASAGTGTGGLFVHGTAQDSTGAAVTGVVLTLADAQGRQVERTRTTADGDYRLTVATGGTYVLIASAGNYQPTASMVVVGDRPVRHDVRMFGSGTVDGVVRSGDLVVAGATVVLTDVRGEVVDSLRAGDDGAFRFGDLVGGSYALTATADGFRPMATPVTVADGQRTSIDVALPSAAALTGVVRSANLGLPVPDARVTLLDASGEVVLATTTDGDGNYTFTDLADGDYTVIATGYPPVATPLRLDGQRATHDVELGY
ncbi:MFS transporter [Saccharopolyspora sp. SCSIO 74807]|uniref:MFS transporter n=1 Tax=Saccharopolyspora sp. SCSIO 74807 TaxID=3118084 RepID=UPI00387E7C94